MLDCIKKEAGLHVPTDEESERPRCPRAVNNVCVEGASVRKEPNAAPGFGTPANCPAKNFLRRSTRRLGHSDGPSVRRWVCLQTTLIRLLDAMSVANGRRFAILRQTKRITFRLIARL